MRLGTPPNYLNLSRQELLSWAAALSALAKSSAVNKDYPAPRPSAAAACPNPGPGVRLTRPRSQPP